MTYGADGRMPGSGSVKNPTYWWYEARARLLETVFANRLPGGRLLDIGSADGPSVDWLGETMDRFATDLDPAGLSERAVCADAVRLPFGDATFDAVSAFDVVEHIQDEDDVLGEIARVLRPSGCVFVSVPAYEWAWSEFDVQAGHHRRYTRPTITGALERNGFQVERATYAFAAVFPMFALDRLRGRLLGQVERVAETRLPTIVAKFLSGLTRIDEWLLRLVDLPFGSSIFVAARLVGGSETPSVGGVLKGTGSQGPVGESSTV